MGGIMTDRELMIDCPRCGHCCPQPNQEPVAWANKDDLQNFDMRVRTGGGPYHTVPLYTTPPQQRQWVGLTDEEIKRLWSQSLADSEGETYLPLQEYAQAIEAKLKEKNT
jgi:hypothetical protein